MKSLETQTARALVFCTLLLLLPGSLHVWEPNTNDLDRAINTGDFDGYLIKISAWLNTKLPADPGSISEAKPVTVNVPNTHSLWGTTPDVDVRLEKGTQTLTLTRPASQRGLALRYLELKAKQ